LEDLGVVGRIILKWILKGPVAGSYEHGSEPSSSKKWAIASLADRSLTSQKGLLSELDTQIIQFSSASCHLVTNCVPKRGKIGKV
jgi:hypothetical protein